MKIDRYLYGTALILQILGGILLLFSFWIMWIVLLISILIKGLAYQIASFERDDLEDELNKIKKNGIKTN